MGERRADQRRLARRNFRDTLDTGERTERSNLLIRLLVGVGAVLIGGGLLLLIGSHWDSQSPDAVSGCC